MGLRSKQNSDRRISNGRKTFLKLLNILSHQENANQKDSEIPYYTYQNAKIKNTDGSLCCRGCGVRGTLLHCWWECKLVQLLWKFVRQCLRKLGINLLQESAYPVLLAINPEKDVQSYHKDTYSAISIGTLFIVARTWKLLRCPSTKD